MQRGQRAGQVPWEEYVHARVLPALGISTGSFEVAPPSHMGTTSTVLVIRGAGFPPLLLRAFRRPGQAARNVRSLRHLEELGLPAPRLRYHDGSARVTPRLRGRRFVTVETWIDGRRVTSLRGSEEWQEAITAVARLMARFRRITRPRWGRLGRTHLRSFRASTLARARWLLRRLRARRWIETEESRDLERRFGSWAGALDQLRPFNLVHKDPNPDNYVFTAEREVIPVDLHRIAYEPFPEDVISLLDHFWPEGGGAEGEFLDEYFVDDAPAREIYDRMAGFFDPLYFLKKLYMCAVTPGYVQEGPLTQHYRDRLSAL